MKYFLPNDHGCGLSGSIDLMGIRGLLHAAFPYEALHVKCTAPAIPRCMLCGRDVPPFINSFIDGLMQLFPDDTECWNPMHKGTVLCIDCERKGKR